ncbi:MAG TPA: patatin-like phospholipase family protein [Vicinamibacterales bacterium]
MQRFDPMRRRSAAFAVVVLALLPPAGDALAANDTMQAADREQRPRIGVAFGGGSARGLAHVGVIRWLAEHRIPVDVVAGTSMGGLVGGAFASGLPAEELARVLADTDWDAMFGSTPFRYKNVRRKQDARAYPARLEFGLKRGIVPPVALNNGQQVEFFLARIVGAYADLRSFDDLPTPFRAVAVDLVSAQQVVLDRGSLASAMRATMSLPGVFPPVEMEGRVLVDGGAMNNVPADVVRSMGADVVIAVNVGFMGDTRTVTYSLLGLMSQTVDVMMQANTRAVMQAAADIVINPPLEGFGSLDWRRSAELADEGYRAAEAIKDRLLPLALDEAGWVAYQEGRRARRKTTLPAPQFLSVVGAVQSDQRHIEDALRARIGQPLDVPALETDLEALGGLDRYETVGWQLVDDSGRAGLQVRARPKANAPPFLMLGLNLQNTTSDEFEVQLAARYLGFDVAGSGSELRIDGAVGALPAIGAELYRPIGGSAVFAALAAGADRQTTKFIQDDVVVAQYDAVRMQVGVDAGVNLGRDSEVRGGVSIGQLNATVAAGDPGLPELDGGETRARLRWLYDGQDSPVVPSSGARTVATIGHTFNAPDVVPEVVTERSNDDLTQAEARASVFWPLRQRDRLFLAGGAGTSFGKQPLPTEQFQLGAPTRLGAYHSGELRGDHYGVVTVGYLRGVGRMPDFLGGPIFLGGWIENGSAFDDIDDAVFRTNLSAGAIVDTLVGPVILGASFDFDGRWRYYIGIGRLF